MEFLGNCWAVYQNGTKNQVPTSHDLASCYNIKVLTHRILFKLAFLAVIFFGKSSFARLEVTIDGLSRSGKTVQINRGTFDGIQDRELAYVVKVFQDPEGKAASMVLGKAQAIKVTDSTSHWFFLDLRQAKELRVGSGYLLMTSSELMAGRRAVNGKRRQLVQALEQEYSVVGDSVQANGDHLAKEKEAIVLHKLKQEKRLIDKDIEFVDLAKWKGDENLHPSGIYSSPYLSDYTDMLREREMQQAAESLASKARDDEFSKKVLLRYNEASPLSTYAAYIDEKEKEWERQERDYKYLRESGKGWSAGLTDQELSRSLDRVGLYSENVRVYKQFQRLRTWQFNLGFGQNFINNQTGDNKVSASNMETELGLEKYVTSPSPFFRKLSFEGMIRRNYDSASADTIGTTFTEDSASFGANYYWNGYPDEKSKIVYYSGIYNRWGKARVLAPENGEALDYSVGPFVPMLKVGAKYFNQEHFGVRVAASFFSGQLVRRERKLDTELLPDKIKYSELKLSVSFIYAF